MAFLSRSDDLGNAPVEIRFHVKNLPATILHLMWRELILSYSYDVLHQKLVGFDGAYTTKQIIFVSATPKEFDSTACGQTPILLVKFASGKIRGFTGLG